MTNREEILLDVIGRMLVELGVIKTDIGLSDLDAVVVAENWLADKKIRNDVAKLWRDATQFDYTYDKALAYVIKNLQRYHTNLSKEDAEEYAEEL